MKADHLSIELRKILDRNDGDVAAVVRLVKARLRQMAQLPFVLTLEYLKSRLCYDPDSGLFTRLSGRVDRIGKPIYGSASGRYVIIDLHGRGYYAHVLAWFYMTGRWPECGIDHKNGLGKHNKWNNLRECTQSQNLANAYFGPKKKSGLPRGVFDRGPSRGRRYAAAIKVNGTIFHLGSYVHPDEAAAVYIAAARHHFGEFAIANRMEKV